MLKRSGSYLVTTVLMLSPPVSVESDSGLMMNQNKTLTIFTTQIAYRKRRGEVFELLQWRRTYGI